jgi:titin
MTISGTPLRAISTAWTWRGWCGAKRRRTPATELAPPATPTDLTAVAVASFRPDLTWSDRSPVEDRFDIAESRNGNSFRVVATVNPNTTSFSRYGLRASTTYVYRVQACNAAGCSAWSNTATATTPRR